MSAAGSVADTRLAELMCARLCHDLAGPIGAIGVSAEVLADLLPSDEALDLLDASAAAAAARLRLLRLAFGGGGGAPLKGAALADMVRGYLAMPGGETPQLDWQDDPAALWDGLLLPLLLNMIVLGRGWLGRGGVIRLARRRESAPWPRITLQGDGLSAPDLRFLTADSPDALGAREAQGYYTSVLAKRLKLRLDIRHGLGQVDLLLVEGSF